MWGEGEFGNSQWGEPKGVVDFEGIERIDGITSRSLTITVFEADGADITPPEGIVYEFHAGLAPSLPFVARMASVPGILATTLLELHPDTPYYVRARARGIDSGYSVESEEHAVATLAGAPVIANQLPAPGTAIARTTQVRFDVTDDSGVFRRVIVHAKFEKTGVVEVVHDGDSFVGFYAAASSRVGISLGYRYTVLRSGGWPAGPAFRVIAIDRDAVEG